MVGLGRAMLQMSKLSDFRVRDYLRKLWSAPRIFSGLWGSMVRLLLHRSSIRPLQGQDAQRFQWGITGRSGRRDPFQADPFRGPSLYTF